VLTYIERLTESEIVHFGGYRFAVWSWSKSDATSVERTDRSQPSHHPDLARRTMSRERAASLYATDPHRDLRLAATVPPDAAAGAAICAQFLSIKRNDLSAPIAKRSETG